MAPTIPEMNPSPTADLCIPVIPRTTSPARSGQSRRGLAFCPRFTTPSQSRFGYAFGPRCESRLMISGAGVRQSHCVSQSSTQACPVRGLASPLSEFSTKSHSGGISPAAPVRI
jgi:hypothetical protein